MACCGRGVCACVVTAGAGITVVGTGTGTSPYVVSGEAATVEVGCGLTGDGTPGNPITAVPAAGEEEWPWTTCDAADESTLRCDPATGQLWTPPEHHVFGDLAPEHDESLAVGPYGPTGGPVVVPGCGTCGSGVDYLAGFGGPCRLWTGTHWWKAEIDVSYTGDVQFRIGYMISRDGGPATFVPVGGILDAGGTAGRQMIIGTANGWSDFQPPGTDQLNYAQPAIEVLAGQLTINDWSTFRGRNFATWSAPI